jgi:hypothetical protein
MHIQEMIRTHPGVRRQGGDALIACIEACYDCAQVCTVCADACLGEPTVADLVACIGLDLNCADICATTGQVVSRATASNPDLTRRMIDTCAEACRLCAEACARHAGQHEHCRICAETCGRCEVACRAAASAIAPLLQ